MTDPELFPRPLAADGLRLRQARSDELRLAIDIDNDACQLFAQAGLHIELPPDHPFVQAEEARWAAAARDGRLFFAEAAEPVGFVSLGHADGAPYLQQVSVRCSWMRRGVGKALIEHAVRWSAGAGSLWLTTYEHLTWNGPYYERLGFARCPEGECGPELRAILRAERLALPHPERRVAMVRRAPT